MTHSQQQLQRHRQTLASALQQLRKSSGLTGQQVADRLGWHQSKVSRLETGRQAPTKDDVRALAEALGGDIETVTSLTESARVMEFEWHMLRDFDARGTQARQAEFQEIESSATLIRTFHQSLVPGLLQVESYASALPSSQPSTDAELAANWELRRERQAQLSNPEKTFTFVLTESVLWNRYAGPNAFRSQLQHLVDLIGEGRASIGIVPRTAHLTTVPLTEFSIYDHSLVSVQTLASEVTFRHPDDVALFEEAYDRYLTVALGGHLAIAIIQDVIDSLP